MPQPQKNNNKDRDLSASVRQYFRELEYPSLGDNLLFWSVIVIGVTLDLWSKYTVFKWLSSLPYPHEYQVIDGVFKLVMRVNPGAAFSIASGHRWPLLTISILALFIVIGIFIFGNVRHKLMKFALALFTAGIIGNLYDRAFNNGLVRDFLDFYIADHHWPAFNIADSMLCISVGLIVICNLEHSDDNKESSPDKQNSSK